MPPILVKALVLAIACGILYVATLLSEPMSSLLTLAGGGLIGSIFPELGKGGPKEPPNGERPVGKFNAPLMLMVVMFALAFAVACSSSSPPPAAPPTSTLPPDDPCEREAIRAFGTQCGADCKAKGGDVDACLEECNKQIDERCGT